MLQEISEQSSEAGDDSLSAITYESDLEMKSKKKTFHKYPPRSPKSPYHTKPKQISSWRYLKAAGAMPLSGRMALTPQKLWLGPSKQGHSPGAPVYREKEDMYDEIIELKKSLHSQKGDVDFMKTKLRRLEEENSRKDRQIEHLLDPNRGCEFARSMVDKRPGTGWVINGLKQRIIKLEQQCKEKDNTITKLQTDIKMTNLEEMRIAMETYYEEIHRLQVLLANTETTGKKSPTDKKSTQKKQKKLSATVLHLSRNVQELQEENQSLKEDLDRVLSNSPISNKAKGYSEWSKQRLMRRISELEKKVGELENTGSHSPEQVRLVPLIQSTPNTAQQDLLRSEHSEDCERLRGIVRKLKADRSALQAQLSDKDLEMKQLLQAKATLEKELKKVEETEKDRKEKEDSMREEIQRLTKKLQEMEVDQRKIEGDPMKITHEAQEDAFISSNITCIQTQQGFVSSSSNTSIQPPTFHSDAGNKEHRRDKAARIIQTQWKIFKRKKKEANLDEAAAVLQAVFRGHLAREKLFSSDTFDSECPSMPSFPNKRSSTSCCSPGLVADNKEEDEAIAVIQSIFRAHSTRMGYHEKTASDSPISEKKPISAVCQKSTCLASTPSSLGKEDSEVSSEETIEELPADDDESMQPKELKALVRQPCCAVSSHTRLQSIVAPPVDEVTSDDSDDIVISPSLPMKKKNSPQV
ncbi:IQ domain-containing protein E isoform X3 [Phascolarctos cinereus]|uniref:IQ domain-containing protein E isoform X3 n=1 Tax=Phascolarctos cinereus TaxID=38626 RepID=A0A6P5J9T6_PHACI|nr:IQ domain-containing protein E isoform X3 [Phascolarctos cinereus]